MYIISLLFGYFLLGNALRITIKTTTSPERIHFLNHFWKNTGLCPMGNDAESRKNFLLSYDEKVNLALIGALPNKAIDHVRIHWLLDLVKISHFDEANHPVYDFQYLDELISWLHDNGLYPGFELMGNPNEHFKNFSEQMEDWSLLIEQVLDRYIDRYGPSYVRSWRFELLNEPDLKMYNSFNFTIDSYLKYFNANKDLIGGLLGPAGLFKNNTKTHRLCWGFLKYCNENPCNLKMITYHKKGNGSGSNVVNGGIDLINEIYSRFPNLKGVPFGNDEADILTGWHHPKNWRADVNYAALAVETIIGHIEEMQVKRTTPFELLSNDNAFLSFYPNQFTQRTLLARFQMNDTFPPHVQFFKKPVYSAMALLSLLGRVLTDIQYSPGEPGISFITTNDKHRTTFLATVTNDKPDDLTYPESQPSSTGINIRIKLENLNRTGYCVVYIMDNVVSNPYQVWRDAGNPDYPPRLLRKMMRLSEGFKRLSIQEIQVTQTSYKLKMKKLKIPSIIAINTCYMGMEEPGQVNNLRYINVTTNEIILLWNDDFMKSKCLLTYAIEFKSENDSDFRRINEYDNIFLSYHVVGGSNDKISGEYRVAGVDYWHRRGLFSEILKVVATPLN